MVIRFSIPSTTANDLRLRTISIPDPSHNIIFLILEKEPVFPVSMLSAKQGNYWYHFYNVLDWGLNPGPPALEASTLPRGYRGGGNQEPDM